ncbi:MAG: SPOR domain-containing protein [Bacteroidia bacterium]|nr:SPOR domain-containing protein [Bacteroidia bacterium]
MIRKLFLFLIILGFSTGYVSAQFFVRTSDLFQKSDENSHAGHLNIIQNPEIDTMISRYILVNKNLKEKNSYYGMEGCRIQIYSSSNRNAKVESRNARAEFFNKFPDITSYELFEGPAWYKIRAGDFRTKTEATRLFLIISKEFPDAYLVHDFINFPDLNTK